MSVAAVAEPIKRRPKRASELDSRSVPIEQKPTIEMPPLGEHVERSGDIVVPETQLTKDYYEALKFNEDPMTIVIHRSAERFGSNVTDLVAVQGIKAEMLFKNGWIQIGYLPRGQHLITKRKYVEQMLRAKRTDYQTRVVEEKDQDPRNFVEPNTYALCSLTVVEDKNPKGAEWLAQLVRQM